MNINEHLKNTPIDFDPEIYIELNDDLSPISCLEAKVHYENTGYLENRKYKYTNIPVDFDPEIYIELNDDLSQMSCLEAKIHYEKYGYLENRKYKYTNIPVDFDPEIYIQVNIDLSQMSFLEAKVHYENTRYLENRKYKYTNIPVDFDPEIYIELNDDLSPISCLEAKVHYENTGYLENRKYKYTNIPVDFDPIEYIKLNKDLKELSYLEAKKHYEIQGYTENRIIKFGYDFDVFVYCCGKTGSSTLYKTLMNNNFKCIHTHSSHFYIYNTRFVEFEPDIFKLIEESSRDKNIYIIDSYRTPIERRLSSFFQHLTNEELEYTYDKIENIIDHLIYEIEDYTSINEVLDYFDLPHFSTFDFKKKYNILKYKNINFIKLRFQDINEWENILTDIFKKPIKIHNENISESKIYTNLYKEIKNKYKIPKSMIGYIKNDIESKIYLSEEEYNNYINYWNKRIK